ncbi:MAG: glycosyltransferase family 39 protein [Candidatus Levybacteria bacterium]|nr:glycosyltransferase family 39 protein [Candidatus Levybacteria bacterium]
MTFFQKLLFILIIFLSLWVRFYHYTYFPQRGATSDEYTYSFLGTSLLSQGVPVSWSAFRAYPKRIDLTIDGIYFPIVSPYFDHPPGYALILGSFLLASGQAAFESQQLATIRLMPIILSTLTGILIFFFVKREYRFSVAILSLFLYSTVTIFVMNQRVSVAENQLALLFVFAIYLFSRWKKKLTRRRVVALGVIAGITFLTKIMGLSLLVFLVLLFLWNRVKYQYTCILVITWMFFVGLLFIYAAYYDWQLFWEIQALQSSRDIGPEALQMLLLQPVIVNKVYYDGWYFVGFLALGFLSLNYKKHLLILIPATVYFLFLLSSLSQAGQSGWYMIPMFPFMVIATAIFVIDVLKKKNVAFLIVCFLVGISQIQYFFEPYFGFSSLTYRVLLGLLFLPLILLFLFKKDVWFGRLSFLYFIFFLLTTIVITYRYVHPS